VSATNGQQTEGQSKSPQNSPQKLFRSGHSGHAAYKSLIYKDFICRGYGRT